MGHIGNSLGLRLSLNRFWRFALDTSLAATGRSDYFFSYFDSIFGSVFFRNRGFIFSHLIVSQVSKNVWVDVFVYDAHFESYLASFTSYQVSPRHHDSFATMVASDWRINLVLPERILLQADSVLDKSGSDVKYVLYFFRYKLYRILGLIFTSDLRLSHGDIMGGVTIRPLSSNYLSSDAILRYITRRLEQHYKLNEVVSSVMRGFSTSSLGVFVKCSGRFTRVQRANTHVYKSGLFPLSTLAMVFDYGYRSVRLKYGLCGVKIWIARSV